MSVQGCLLRALLILTLLASGAAAARIRPDGDPATDRVIWADPFDNYSQWAQDHRDDPAYQPNGTTWQGGPMPAGSSNGIYPYKSDNGDPSQPYNGCGVVYQEKPALHYLARQQWVANSCPNYITTPAGVAVGPCTFYAGPDSFTANTNCLGGGWVETIAEFGRVDSVWQSVSGYYTSLNIFTHNLVPRIQSWSPLRAWDQPTPNAAQGTDEHPLTLVFYLHDSGGPANRRAFVNNTYVELNLDDDHAPTDYIWRGKRDKTYDTGDPECCPEGPYPVICQQVREVNPGNYEQQQDLDYLNAHCPSLVPPYDPVTKTGKTWHAIAFGFLAIGDKDPCKCAEQGVAAHQPQMNHPMLFDGNVWRELRAGRGTALAECPPSWGPGPEELGGPETTMQDTGAGSCGDFTLGGGTHKVYLKLTTNRILIWMWTRSRSGGVTTEYNYCGAFDRVYKGPFNRVALGVGPGCELQDKAAQGDAYTCKAGGTPKRCLTYSNTNYNGYWRTNCDSMSLLDGVLVQNSNVGGCCLPDGTCQSLTQSECETAGGIYRGAGTICGGSLCTGACCLPMSTCTETNDGSCAGTFRGIGTRCSDVPGCPCPAPWADYDGDEDVDLDDFGRFQQCFTGPGVQAGTACRCYDRNDATGAPGGDGDVDLDDFAWFRNCATGPNLPLDTVDPPPGCVP